MILIGCVLGPKAASRSAEINAIFEDRKATGSLTLEIVSDFLEAAFMAEERATAGEGVIIAGAIEDLSIPADFAREDTQGFGVIEWRESWLARLEKNHIGFIPLATGDSPQVPREALLATSIIRSYTRASAALDKAIKRIQAREQRALSEKRATVTGHVTGRPPYGYRVQKGRLVKVEKQTKVIEMIFTKVREGANSNVCLNHLKNKKVPGYWDRVKIRRIIKHAPLYCRGVCTAGKNSFVVPHLAFLPEEWANTTIPKVTP